VGRVPCEAGAAADVTGQDSCTDFAPADLPLSHCPSGRTALSSASTALLCSRNTPLAPGAATRHPRRATPRLRVQAPLGGRAVVSRPALVVADARVRPRVQQQVVHLPACQAHTSVRPVSGGHCSGCGVLGAALHACTTTQSHSSRAAHLSVVRDGCVEQRCLAVCVLRVYVRARPDEHLDSRPLGREPPAGAQPSCLLSPCAEVCIRPTGAHAALGSASSHAQPDTRRPAVREERLTWPRSTAKCSGVQPMSSLLLASAPASRRALRPSTSPSPASSCSVAGPFKGMQAGHTAGWLRRTAQTARLCSCRAGPGCRGPRSAG
jgi:hypothetical protein